MGISSTAVGANLGIRLLDPVLTMNRLPLEVKRRSSGLCKPGKAASSRCSSLIEIVLSVVAYSPDSKAADDSGFRVLQRGFQVFSSHTSQGLTKRYSRPIG
jgi:hypothetical protein